MTSPYLKILLCFQGEIQRYLKSLENQETDIGSAIVQETMYTLECSFCDSTSEWSDMNLEEAKQSFLNAGWRYRSSESRKQCGIACPACIRALDKEFSHA